MFVEGCRCREPVPRDRRCPGEWIALPEFGLIFYNLPGHDLTRFVSFASTSGFTCAEIAVRHVWDGTDTAAAAQRATELGRLLSEHGMRLSALSAGNNFIQPGDDELRLEVERLRQVCLLARRAGTSLLRIDGGSPRRSGVPEDRWRTQIVAALKALRPFIESEGFILALDNHGVVTNDADLQVQIFEEVGSRNIGANLDTMNYRWFGHALDTVARFYQVIAPYVRHTHIKDGRGARPAYAGTALGEGELDLPAAVEALRAAHYAGPWVVEYEGRTDQEEGYRQGLRWLREHVPVGA